MNHRITAIILFLVIMIFLYWFAEQPIAVGLILPPYDKLAHAFMGAGLAVLLCFIFKGKYPWLTIGIVALLSALEEWHQRFLPGRVPDFYDFFAATAAACFVVIFLYWRKKNPIVL